MSVWTAPVLPIAEVVLHGSIGLGGMAPMQHSVNVIALVKDSEHYVFLYDENDEATLMETLGRFASDPELSFTWYDAAVLSQRVRRMRLEADELDQPEEFRRSA